MEVSTSMKIRGTAAILVALLFAWLGLIQNVHAAAAPGLIGKTEEELDHAYTRNDNKNLTGEPIAPAVKTVCYSGVPGLDQTLIVGFGKNGKSCYVLLLDKQAQKEQKAAPVPMLSVNRLLKTLGLTDKPTVTEVLKTVFPLASARIDHSMTITILSASGGTHSGVMKYSKVEVDIEKIVSQFSSGAGYVSYDRKSDGWAKICKMNRYANSYQDVKNDIEGAFDFKITDADTFWQWTIKELLYQLDNGHPQAGSVSSNDVFRRLSYEQAVCAEKGMGSTLPRLRAAGLEAVRCASVSMQTAEETALALVKASDQPFVKGLVVEARKPPSTPAPTRALWVLAMLQRADLEKNDPIVAPVQTLIADVVKRYDKDGNGELSDEEIAAARTELTKE
jgi:hypothetical protein